MSMSNTEHETEVWKVGAFQVTLTLSQEEIGEVVDIDCECEDYQRVSQCKHANWVEIVRAGPHTRRVE